MNIIIGIILILILIDIYLRIRNHSSHIAYLLMVSDIINKTLKDKGLITREEVDKARKEILDKLRSAGFKEYKTWKKLLTKRGIDIEKDIDTEEGVSEGMLGRTFKNKKSK